MSINRELDLPNNNYPSRPALRCVQVQQRCKVNSFLLIFFCYFFKLYFYNIVFFFCALKRLTPLDPASLPLAA